MRHDLVCNGSWTYLQVCMHPMCLCLQVSTTQEFTFTEPILAQYVRVVFHTNYWNDRDYVTINYIGFRGPALSCPSPPPCSPSALGCTFLSPPLRL